MKITNGFIYETSTGTTKGLFNIYQAKNGSIQLCMGRGNTLLSQTQINALNIDVMELKEFDIDLYNEYYQAQNDFIPRSVAFKIANSFYGSDYPLQPVQFNRAAKELGY